MSAAKRSKSGKGLGKGSVDTLGALVIGLSCCAPAYTLTAALGPAALQVKEKLPAIFIVGFIPMFLVAMGYNALNRAMPDSGTSFTWSTKAFGPWVGWMTGWGLLSATILVLSNLAGIAGTFLFLALGQIFNSDAITHLAQNVPLNIALCLVFLGVATWISFRGMQSTKGFQYFMVAFQIFVLLWFIIAAFLGAHDGKAPESLPISLDWFNPFSIPSFSDFAAGVAVSIFVYWGWDTVLTLNEETDEDETKSPSTLAATILIILLVGLYTTIAAVTVGYAGVGNGPTGLGNADISGNIFYALSKPLMGWAAVFLSLAVLCSSAASLQSTELSPARTLLAMGHYKAIPSKFAEIHPVFESPSFAILFSGLTAGVFYSVMRIISNNALWDTITALGMLVCFYYGITAFACVWYFRREAFRSIQAFFMKFLLPGLGGVLLFIIFIKTSIDSINPSFGSGDEICGVGLVFIMGVGVLLLGVILMIVMSFLYPAFFRGKVLTQETPLVKYE